MDSLTIAGFMSGTSMDALDCCIAKISINLNHTFDYQILAQESFDFDCEIQSEIKKYIGETENDKINQINQYLGEKFLDLSKNFLSKHQIDYIAIHGQTIHHQNKVRSIQVGCPSYLASFFKVPVIYNFREKDISLGGTGAPLMPFLDWLIFKDKDLNTLTLNLGGIANVAFIPKQADRKDVIGFDTGPGMSLIDECVHYFWSKKCDYNGKYSIEGRINEDMLDYLTQKTPFILSDPPKSTGREDFGKKTLLEIIKRYNDLKPVDILRTLVKFTSLSIKLNVEKFILTNHSIDQIIISGGGLDHPVLISDIKKDLDIPIINMIDYGVKSKFKEGLLMAVLGYSKINKIKSNMPSVTGASNEVILGDICES